MSEVGSAFVSLVPSAKGFGSATEKQVGGEMSSAGKKIGSKFGTAIKAGALLAVGGAFAAGKFLSGALDEAREAQVVGARTDNVIKKMGATAWTSSRGVAALAGQLSTKVGVDDEAIQSGENLLLTFGNIQDRFGKGNDIFRQTTGLMVDMSSAMGQDMKSSAIQLGKALNDPTKGVTALSRVGVAFTEQQKAQIKKLQESGNILGAQKIILGEVKKEFSGAAEAMATPGQKAAVAWGNLKEQIGTGLLPIVDKLLGFLTTKIIPAVSKFIAGIHGGKGEVGKFAGALGDAMSKAVTFIGPLVTMLRGAALTAFKALSTFVTGSLLPSLKNLWVALTPTLMEAFHLVTAAVVQIVGALRFLGPTLVAVTGFIAQHKVALTAILITIGTAVGLWKAWQLAIAAWSAVTKIATAVQAALNVVLSANPIGLVILALAALAVGLTYAYKKSDAFRALVVSAFSAVKNAAMSVFNFIKAKWPILLIILTGPFGAATALIAKNWDRIKGVVNGGIDGVVEAVKNLPSKILALGGSFLNAGKELIGKFVDGMKNAAGIIGGIAGNVWDTVKGLLNSAIDKINNALEFKISLPGPDLSVNLPDIPHLAKGGIVSRPTLALIGEAGPEAVVPLSKVSSTLAQGRADAGAAGGRSAFTITNWREGTGYFEQVADGRIDTHFDLTREHARASR